MNKNTEQNNRRGFLSKMLVAGTSGVALLSSSVFAGGKGSGNSGTTELDDDQKDRLFFIYQEEKVARDVYHYLGELYPDESTFASIQLAEQRHMDSAQELCVRYGIDISEVDESVYGEFFVDYLKKLYKKCINLGEKELIDALKVGVLIEETDIGTLTDTINAIDVDTMPADVVSTYLTLREGSYNHLESFEARLARV